MNCYKALKINSFSGSVGIDSKGGDFVSGPTGDGYGEFREVNGTCNIITPFTDFTNRELKCRALLDYRVENDPEIAERGWLIRRHYVISGVDGLCANCGLEGDLKYENDGVVEGTVTDTYGNTKSVNFNPGQWNASGGPWFNKFQYCTRAQEYLFAQRHPPDPWVFQTGGGAGILGTALAFKCYDAFNGSASDSKSYDFPPTEYDPNHYTGYANGTFTWNVTIE